MKFPQFPHPIHKAKTIYREVLSTLQALTTALAENARVYSTVTNQLAAIEKRLAAIQLATEYAAEATPIIGKSVFTKNAPKF
jgi:hypothetical protein